MTNNPNVYYSFEAGPSGDIVISRSDGPSFVGPIAICEEFNDLLAQVRELTSKVAALNAIAGPGDAPRLIAPNPVVRERAARLGLEFHDGHWYRLAGWGKPCSWALERVFVPTDHAERLIDAS